MKKINNVSFISASKMKSGLIAFTALSLKKVTTKTVKEENIDDRDAYLNIRETATHVKINRKLNPYDKANKIPK